MPTTEMHPDKKMTIGKAGVFTQHMKGRAIGKVQNLTSIWAQFDYKWSGFTVGTAPPQAGLLVRTVNKENFFAVLIGDNASPSRSFVNGFSVIAGAKSGPEVFGVIPWDPTVWTTVVVGVIGTRVVIYIGPQNGLLLPYAAGEIPLLGTTLKEGSVYLYDHNETAFACQREYDNLAVWEAVPDAVAFAGRQMEIRSDGIFRQDSAAEIWGRIVPDAGNYPYAPPSWMEGRAARGIVIGSRGDLDQLGDLGGAEVNKLAHKAIYLPGYHFASEAGASSYAEVLRKRAAELEFQYLVIPMNSEIAVVNKGAATVPNATLANGAALSENGLITGARSVSFSSDHNDYIDTNFLTRNNMLAQPSPEVANTQWTGGGGFFNNPCTLTRDIATAQFDGVACWKAVCTGAANLEGFATGAGINALVKNQEYTASVYLKGAVGGEEVKVGIGSAVVGNAVSALVKLSATEWKRVSVTFKATESGAAAMAIIGPEAKKVQTFYADCAMVENSNELRAYFPLVAEIASGLSVFQGTAWESTCDYGPFARACSRWFHGVALVKSNAVNNSLMSNTGVGASVLMRVQSGTRHIKFWPNTELGEVTWENAVPAIGTKFTWDLVFDQVNNTAELFINGVSQGVKVMANDFIFNIPPAGRITLEIGSWGVGGESMEGSALPFGVATKKPTTEQVESMYF